MNKTVVLITGASSGIGKATAELLATEGYIVYGTSRSAKGTLVLGDSNGGSFTLIQLDVTKDDSVEDCIRYIMEQEGQLDVLINNAGFGIAGAIEDTSVDEMKSQLETNLVGVHRVTKAVLPIMRRQGHGRIVNLSSIGGIMALPYQAFYSVSKYGIEAYTRALRGEVAGFGIKVSLVQPGDIKTGFTSQRKVTEASKDSVYKERFDASLKRMANDEQTGPEPIVIAKIIRRILKRKNPPVSATCGIYRIIKWLQKILPEKLVAFAMRLLYA